MPRPGPSPSTSAPGSLGWRHRGQGMPAEILFEDGKLKYLERKWRTLGSLLLRIAVHCAVMLAALSIGRATKYLPFLSEVPSLWVWPWSLPALYLQTVWVYCMLAICMLAHRTVATLFGFDTLVSMKAPLVQSTSIRDFWGRRWNLIVHNLMKRCFFLPLQSGGVWKKNLGGFAAFLMLMP